MRRLVLISFAAILLLSVSTSLFAQATLTQTTLSAAIDDSTTIVYLASSSGFAAGNYVFIDREAMKVVGPGAAANSIQVLRGVVNTTSKPHASGQTIYAGLPSYFLPSDPSGACTSALQPALPTFNLVTGNKFDCVSGSWSNLSSGGGGATINTTNGTIPVRSNATTFIDSPESVSGGNVTNSGSYTATDFIPNTILAWHTKSCEALVNGGNCWNFYSASALSTDRDWFWPDSTPVSGGVLGFTSNSTPAFSVALNANVLVKGGGAGATPSNSLITENGTTATYTGTGGYVAPKFVTDGTACVGCGGGADGTEGTAPPAATSHDVLWADSVAHRYKMSNNNGTAVQVVASGADINTSDQVTATHLAAALPVNQGGTGTTSTLAGLVRGSASTMTAAELSGDCGTSGTNAIVCTQINGSNFTVNSSGLPTKVDGITTAGQGVAIVQCVTSQKTESAADTNVLTCTPASAAGSYRIRFTMSVSAANAAVLGWTVTYTDSNGNAQTPTNLALTQQGAAAPALTFTTSVAGNYYSEAQVDVNNAGTNIVVKTTFSGTSFTAKVSATIERII